MSPTITQPRLGADAWSTEQQVDAPLRITVADDDENDHLLLQLAAEEADARLDLRFAFDGAQLIDMLTERDRAGEQDMVILDLRMPGVGGHAALAQLREFDHLLEVPVLVLSSSTRPEDQQRSFELGANWYESKPSSFADLVALVSDLPNRYQQLKGSGR